MIFISPLFFSFVVVELITRLLILESIKWNKMIFDYCYYCAYGGNMFVLSGWGRIIKWIKWLGKKAFDFYHSRIVPSLEHNSPTTTIAAAAAYQQRHFGVLMFVHSFTLSHIKYAKKNTRTPSAYIYFVQLSIYQSSKFLFPVMITRQIWEIAWKFHKISSSGNENLKFFRVE